MSKRSSQRSREDAGSANGQVRHVRGEEEVALRKDLFLVAAGAVGQVVCQSHFQEMFG